MAGHVTKSELDAGLAHVLAAPKDHGPIDSLCFRPGFNQRQFPDQLHLTTAAGVPGERWLTQPWLRSADGSPHPGIQVSILPRRVADLVWRDRAAQPHPGDTIIADLDLTEANLPVGSTIRAGTALLQVSDVFNDACVKWKVRYGAEAKDWITAPGHPPLRLRGALCAIIEDGTVSLSDRLEVVSRG